jgi:hypothetical protein
VRQRREAHCFYAQAKFAIGTKARCIGSGAALIAASGRTLLHPRAGGAQAKDTMTRIVNVITGICLCSGWAAAQRGGMGVGHSGMGPSGGHGARPGGPPHVSQSPTHPWTGWGGIRPGRHGENGFHAPWNEPFRGMSYFAPAWPFDWADTAQGQNSVGPVMFMMQPSPQAPPEPAAPPAPPVRPEMREYSWPQSDTESARPFAIILKDGTARVAVATCRQDSRLTYVGPDGKGSEVEIGAVDREATRRANSTDLLY